MCFCSIFASYASVGEKIYHIYQKCRKLHIMSMIKAGR